MTEGESKALVASSLLVLLSVLGRTLLSPPAAEITADGIRDAGRVESALAVAESASASIERRSSPLRPGERIDPNTADEEELDRLPGVGPALAAAIVETRRGEGPFESLADLERVPGLGSSTVRRLGPYIALPRTDGGRGAMDGSASDSRGPRKPPSRLDLNRASEGDLESLPGIGPTRAAAIVRWRREHGRFVELEDLLEVPGIGPATLERLRSLVRIGA